MEKVIHTLLKTLIFALFSTCFYKKRVDKCVDKVDSNRFVTFAKLFCYGNICPATLI